MMRWIRVCLLALTLCTTTAWALTPEAVVRSFYKAHVVRGQYTQTYQIKQYPQPISSEGSFVIVPKRAILWEEKGLYPTKTIYRDSSFHIYQEIGLDRVIRVSNPVTNMVNRMLWAIFSGDFIGLRQDFVIETRQNGNSWTMDFHPRSSMAKATIQSLHAEGSPLPTRLICHTVVGDQSRLELYDLQQTLGTLTSEEEALANP